MARRPVRALRMLPACSASPRSAPRTRSAISRAIGANGSTRICQSAERARRSAITRACRSTTPHVCARTAGMRRSGRCRSDSASRTRPTTRTRRGLRIGSTVDPISQDAISWDITVMWMLPHRTIYMDGRHPSPNAQLAGILDGRVGRRHAQGDDDAPEGRLGAAQRLAARNDARRVFHSQREVPDARHVVDPVYLTEPLVRVGLGSRHGIAAEPVLVHPGHRDRAAAGRGASSLAGNEFFPRGILATPWLADRAARGGAQTMYPKYVLLGSGASSRVGAVNYRSPAMLDTRSRTVGLRSSKPMRSRRRSSRSCRRKAAWSHDRWTAARRCRSATRPSSSSTQDAAVATSTRWRSRSSARSRSVTSSTERRSRAHGRQRGGIARRHVRAPHRHVRSALRRARGRSSRVNVLGRMSSPTGTQAPAPAGAWPSDVLHRRLGAVRERRSVAAHSRPRGPHRRRHDRVFPPLRRDRTGDIYTSRYPRFDADKGGSVAGSSKA